MITAAEIAKQLTSDDATPAQVLDLRTAIAERRGTLNARLSQIESERRATFDPKQRITLAQEAEVIGDELDVLHELDTTSFEVHSQALGREAAELGREARKALPKALKLATAAKAEAAQRLLELREIATRLAAARSYSKSGEPALDQETFDQIAALLFDASAPTPDQLKGGKRALRRDLVGPEPDTNYLHDLHDPTFAPRPASPFARRDS
jgi:hypothetical protein